MPVEAHLHPKTPNTIRFDFIGRWTWDQLSIAAQYDAQRIRPSPTPVYYILNFKPESASPGLGMFPFARDLMQRVQADILHVYVVTSIPIVRFMAVTFCRMYTHLGRQITICASLDEAEMAILRQIEPPAE